MQAQGGPQAQQPAGAGGAAQAQGGPQAQLPTGASPLDSMVTPAQVLIIAGLPRAAALALVQAAQVPTQVGDSDDTVRRKLTIAVWAAETLRSPLDFGAFLLQFVLQLWATLASMQRGQSRCRMRS